ncbi:hypothetical protein [Rhodococcus spongiicola]|uniref:Uncharacterized protein n=1 Tax=Rhodococcus spongiicola TaxID=2487352 RepID=A0A3S3B9X6_9NOCA|nr:hypothetical protein [Rhodococcus spongiicola]RVW06535.1 hypothetical protein EF834_03765 [Rhodococcus spongiicola]
MVTLNPPDLHSDWIRHVEKAITSSVADSTKHTWESLCVAVGMSEKALFGRFKGKPPFKLVELVAIADELRIEAGSLLPPTFRTLSDVGKKSA